MKLKVFNPSGVCAAHNAAARNRVAILGLIAQHNGGKSIDCRRTRDFFHQPIFI